MAEFCDVARQKKFREQESACIYVPPPLRSRRSTENKASDTSPQLSSLKNKLTREFQGRDSSNNQSSKKCENSYMLFDLDKKSSTIACKKNTKVSDVQYSRHSSDDSADVLKNLNSSKVPKPKTKKCDNSYLLFSKESEVGGLDYSDISNSKRSNYKSGKKQVSNSFKEQVPQNVSLSTDSGISKIPPIQNDITSANSEPQKSENSSMYEDLSLRLGTFSVSNRSLLKENYKYEEHFSKPMSHTSQKKCDNSSLLFSEFSSNNAHSPETSEMLHKSHSSNKSLLDPSNNFNSSSDAIIVSGDKLSIEKTSRKRPFLNDCQETDDCSNTSVPISSEEIASKTPLLKTPDFHTSTLSGSETIDSIEDYVVEMYDFPVTFKTQDLMTIFSIYTQDGLYIKWVDDTHALGVFSNPLVVADVLKNTHALVKVRTLQNALATSQEIASSIPIPCASRPKTCPSLARRLVSGALGLRVAVSDQVKQAEKKILQDAKAERRLAAKQREEAWEGTLRSNLGSHPS